MDLLRELFDQQKSTLEHFFHSMNLSEMERIFQALQRCTGTIFVTGVGKSGLVAQKIEATLVSTGTKASFLCPSNALHGDIGALAPGDLLLLFSKSGETQELLDLLPYVEKKRVQTAAIVSTRGSILEKRCGISVHLPLLRELCPYDLAPTSSTAIQLIFGDVLAIALMRQKQFSVEDFAANHPAGILGKMIGYQVSDLMLKGDQIPFCSPSDKLIDMLHELSLKRCGCLVVVDEAKTLQGIFTDGDLRRCIRAQGAPALEYALGDLMTKHPKTIGPDRLAVDAVRAMEGDPNRLITVLPVLDREKVIGLIRMHDILQTSLR